MLLMIEEEVRGGIFQVNNYDKRKIISYLMYLDANNLYGWAMIQKLPINGFKWVEKLSKFNEKLMEGYNKNSDRGYFLKVDVNYLKTLFNSHKDLLFLPKRTTKKKGKKASLWCRRQRKICCSHKSFKTSTNS